MTRIFLFVFFLSWHSLVGQTLNDLSFGSDTTFDIVSWNIEWFPKNNTTSNIVQEILTNLEADVYALQEIEDTTLLKQIVSNIPGYVCYFKSVNYGGLAYIYNTNTIQLNSKYEIFNSPTYWNAFPRSPQVLDFDFMGNNYVIINNHFKCCGDGLLNTNDNNDEENRRLQAVTYLKQFIDYSYSNKRVILLGDLNDNLTDNTSNNVFQDLISDDTNYLFTDMLIAQGTSLNWSYPSWPSHLDHILITNELFLDYLNPNSEISVIKIDDYMGGWSNYDNNVSDHRPVGLKLNFNTSNYIAQSINLDKKIIKVLDIFGNDVINKKRGLIFKIYDDGSVEKKLIVD